MVTYNEKRIIGKCKKVIKKDFLKFHYDKTTDTNFDINLSANAKLRSLQNLFLDYTQVGYSKNSKLSFFWYQLC